MRSRKKTILLSAALGIVVAAAAAAWLAREPLLERWWIHRLSSDDPEVRSTMVERLGRSGQDAAALALAEGIGDPGKLGPDAVEALQKTLERSRPATKVWVARRVLHVAEPNQVFPVTKLLSEMAEREAGTLDAFVEALENIEPFVNDAEGPVDLEDIFEPVEEIELSGPEASFFLVPILARSWPSVRDRVEAWLGRAEPGRIVRFLAQVRSILDRDTWYPALHELFAAAESNARGLLDELARGHPRPVVRAVALAMAVSSEQADEEHGMHRERLTRAFTDPDLLVKTTALELAGLFAVEADWLDLKAEILSGKDTGLLTAAIEARTLAASRPDGVDRLVLAPALVIEIPPVDGSVPPPRPFDREEVRRLEAILREAVDPALRDAASCALAVAARSGPPSTSNAPVSAACPGLEVREWSVWKELPRPAAGAPAAMATVQSAVFFHGVAPGILDVRVSLLGGKPTDARPGFTTLFGMESSGRIGLRSGVFLDAPTDVPPEPDRAFWSHPRDAPRSSADGKDETRPSFQATSFRRLVPWAFHSSWTPNISDLRGFGLAWKGLRVGYGPGLEGEIGSSSTDGPGGRWVAARGVASISVALRGRHEPFLTYEGSAIAASPIVVEWADRTKQALAIRVRDFLSLPHVHDWEDYDYDYRELLRGGKRIVPSTAHVPAVIVVRKEASTAPRGTCLRNLPSRSTPPAIALDRLDLEGGALRECLEDVLEAQGLTRAEGEGLLASWEEDLLGREGVRVLTVVPRWLHDAVLPLEVVPAPEKTTRIGIVWRECDGLAVRSPVPEEPAGLAGPAEPLVIETSRLETRKQPFEPGPSVPFEVREDGLLAGIWPGQNNFLFAEDGRFVAQIRDGLGGIEIYIGDLEMRRFTLGARLPAPLFPADYTFSGDGSRVAMLVMDGSRHRVFVADIRGGALIELLTEFAALDWSHSSRDGRMVSFLEDGEPRLFDLETGELRRFRLPRGAKGFYPMLTPDGKKMALILETTVKVKGDDEGTKRAQIVLVDLEAGSFRRLANLSGTHRHPSISPDGKKVLFTRDENNRFWLYLADLDGSRLLRISPHIPTMHCRGVTDDGSTAIFTNETGIWATDLRTGSSRLAYAPRGFKIRDGGVSSDGKKALLLGAHPETGRVLGIHHVDLDPGGK